MAILTSIDSYARKSNKARKMGGLTETILGKETSYPDHYDPKLLFPIARSLSRQNFPSSFPFRGEDLWTAYELSWLNNKGKPVTAIGEFSFPANSPFLIESKSFKLYLNSFNNEKFSSLNEVRSRLEQDLSNACKEIPIIQLFSSSSYSSEEPAGILLDDLDIEISSYQISSEYLQVDSFLASETFVTHLFKSNCPVTSQPDWATVIIAYNGKKIIPEALLKYLISFRSHLGFHEACVEKIFFDLLSYCTPDSLTVEARFTRRGGLDINPIRSTENTWKKSKRTFRQ